jgi:hypothetical protein
MKSTGHKDIDGNWVEENPQAKLRNQLGPFWTLIDILSSDRLDKTLSNDILEKIESGIINLEFSKITDEEVEQLSNKLDSMSDDEK